jgi:hypothetical protein
MWNEMVPYLITAIATVFSIAIGSFFFRIVWYLYGKLDLDKVATVTQPIPIGNEFHYYIKATVRNKTKKAFIDVKPIVKLEGEGRAEYISDKPYYEIKTEGELCWGGSESSKRTIYPSEVTQIDLFRVILPEKPLKDLSSARLQMPSEKGWGKPRTLLVKRDGEILEPKDSMTCELFLHLDWKGE